MYVENYIFLNMPPSQELYHINTHDWVCYNFFNQSFIVKHLDYVIFCISIILEWSFYICNKSLLQHNCFFWDFLQITSLAQRVWTFHQFLLPFLFFFFFYRIFNFTLSPAWEKYIFSELIEHWAVLFFKLLLSDILFLFQFVSLSSGTGKYVNSDDNAAGDGEDDDDDKMMHSSACKWFPFLNLP